MLRAKIGLAACAAFVACLGSSAFGGGGGEHGVGATKGCLTRCVGETTDCTATVTFLDDFDDAIEVTDAWDEVAAASGMVRVPAAGNLPIIAVLGNAICTDDGGICDPGTGANCALPCILGAAGSTVEGLPGLPGNGRVRFAQNQYVIQPDDPADLGDTVHFTWNDRCNSGEFNCPQTALTTPAGSNTIVPDCADDNACTTDTCEAGVCSNIADCATDADCEDGDACAADVCLGGCCASSPVDCNDGNDCTTDSCDPQTGCSNVPDCASDGDCNDGDACTADVCLAGCCASSHVDCDDDNVCTDDRCDSTTGCVFDDNSARCNDGNDCTEDSCDPQSGCSNVPDCASDADCDDGNACTDDFCIDSCCETRPVVCDDGDECTEDTCDPQTGCSSTPIDPPPAGCASHAGCTPGFWKQQQHLQYWNTYAPGDLFSVVFGVPGARDGLSLLKVLGAGGGGEIAMGRHAVAALLNSTNPEVSYAFSTAEVIAMVQDAYATGDFQSAHFAFEEQNELGCTVDKSRSNSSEPRGTSRNKTGR